MMRQQPAAPKRHNPHNHHRKWRHPAAPKAIKPTHRASQAAQARQCSQQTSCRTQQRVKMDRGGGKRRCCRGCRRVQACVIILHIFALCWAADKLRASMCKMMTRRHPFTFCNLYAFPPPRPLTCCRMRAASSLLAALPCLRCLAGSRGRLAGLLACWLCGNPTQPLQEMAAGSCAKVPQPNPTATQAGHAAFRRKCSPCPSLTPGPECRCT